MVVIGCGVWEWVMDTGTASSAQEGRSEVYREREESGGTLGSGGGAVGTWRDALKCLCTMVTVRPRYAML